MVKNYGHYVNDIPNIQEYEKDLVKIDMHTGTVIP